MRRVLIVAYYFPPLGGVGSVRVSGFARNLPAHGWEPTVLAPRNAAYHRDERLEVREESVVRTGSIELSRAGKRLLRAGGDDVKPAELGPLGSVLGGAVRAAIYYPDAQNGWYVPAVTAARRLLRRQKFDAVFSSSFPITAHLIAKHIHRRARLPWVAEFRDPWSETIPPGTSRHRRAARLESGLARAASERVMASPTWARRHADRWGVPVDVITNGFDPDVQPPSRPPPSTFTVAYLGTFYPTTQSLSGAWPALRSLLDRWPEMRIRFIGELHPALRAELERDELDATVQVTGFLPHDDALSELRGASALLVAGPRDASGVFAGQIAAKLFEYLATDVPIVYVGDTCGDAVDLLRGFPGCHVCALDDVQAIEAAFIASHGQRHQRDASMYTSPSLTRRLAEILDRAVRVPTAGWSGGPSP